ncbi:MAG: RNA polymerase sigma factor [Oscillospiraceae bacterium]|nr:RNA polymerase sigma factor [Oscillospiraceae bacterium]
MSSPSVKTEQTHRPDREILDRLLLAVGAGDREALARLYEETRGAVYAAALGVLGNHHEAQDVTQEAFVRIWENAPGYRSQGSPMAWMLTITRNLARMSLRREGRKGELSPEEWESIPAGEEQEAAEDRMALREALASLDSEERQIILLHAVSGLKHREIAALIERPLSTVLSRYQRGLKKLKKQLEGEEQP